MSNIGGNATKQIGGVTMAKGVPKAAKGAPKAAKGVPTARKKFKVHVEQRDGSYSEFNYVFEADNRASAEAYLRSIFEADIVIEWI